jgi:hypothetical protein
MEQAKDVLPNVAFCDGPYDCVEETDVAVIVTEWEQFRALDLAKLRDLMACPVVVDLRNVYRPEDMKNAGFAYTCVGRAPTHQPMGLYIPPAPAPSLSRSEAPIEIRLTMMGLPLPKSCSRRTDAELAPANWGKTSEAEFP